MSLRPVSCGIKNEKNITFVKYTKNFVYFPLQIYPKSLIAIWKISKSLLKKREEKMFKTNSKMVLEIKRVSKKKSVFVKQI